MEKKHIITAVAGILTTTVCLMFVPSYNSSLARNSVPDCVAIGLLISLFAGVAVGYIANFLVEWLED